MTAPTIALAACLALAPEAEIAAHEAGVPTALVLGLLHVETGCRAIEGRYHDVTGPGQVSWPHWGALLAAEGWTDADLLDESRGALAVGPVLRVLRARYGLSGPRMLCVYSVGTAGLRMSDCGYARRVRAAAEVYR